ncbi:MAG TPA: peptidylprolyl isomerase [Pseudonocardia sp.]|nr:peptidylprolyl isomerase [Pseudonocardia sp.]
MATNQMRREAAKRKLERQQERRMQQARRRRQVAVITSAVVVVVVLVGVVVLGSLGGDDPATDPAAAQPTATAPGEPVSCEYPAGGEPAKPVQAPPTEDVATEGTVTVTLRTGAGEIPLTLDRAAAPCTVNSFVSLTEQGYFDGTPCHRLTTGEGLKVLQCGDPSGAGTGGPGYTIPDEPPTDLPPAEGQPGAVTYGRGLVAMAKTAAPNSGGSQFFLVYGDSTLPPEYTVFGRIGEPGLGVLDQVAAAGLAEGGRPGDGAPAAPVTIEAATLAG